MSKSGKTGWNFDNSYNNLPKVFFSTINPTPVQDPNLIIFNDKLATILGLDIDELQSESGIKVLAGNKVPEGSIPLAQAYAGHQFGNFTMLGDGRAVLLGEQITPHGNRFDIQLKGAGKTPFSRSGDGRAGVGPMLREYLISEAMHSLGIPTSRGLAVVTTGEKIYRETEQQGAVLTRVAASHLRIGTFQYVAKWGTIEELEDLVNYAIKRHFPEVKDDKNKYLSFFQKVMERQAALVAKWQLVGFIHGVMNTDNTTISGETIDYGPCAFIDTYDPSTVFSSIDRQGRYAYQNQPVITQWNLTRLIETLLPLIHENRDEAILIAENTLENFKQLYESNWHAGMRSKLGLFDQESEDELLINDLLQIMEKTGVDYTNTFLSLTFNSKEDPDLFKNGEFLKWKERWTARRDRQTESLVSSKKLMMNHNPALIPRNHRVEEALEAAENSDDYSVFRRLLLVLENPYAHTDGQEEYASLPKSTVPYRTYCGT